MRPIDADAIEYEKQSLETDSSIEWLSVVKEDIDAMPTLYDIEAIRQDIKDIMPQYADGTGWDEGRRFALKEVLHIIDKHIQNPQDHFAEVGKISVMDKTQDCDTCKHHNKTWDELPCDGCCTAHSGYESQAVDERVDEKVDRAFDKLLEPFKKGETE